LRAGQYPPLLSKDAAPSIRGMVDKRQVFGKRAMLRHQHHDPERPEPLAGLPFINMELVDPEAFRQFTERTFATDRNLVPKGMVEVVL
jgi:hypothetical protein